MKKRVLLFLCTGNSCRSQMAHGWLAHLAGDRYDVYSAGLETHGVNPRAIQVMAEAGVNISSHTSNAVTEYLNQSFDLLVTVCGGRSWPVPGPRDTGPSLGGGRSWPVPGPRDTGPSLGGGAEEACPIFVGKVKARQHWPFDDPAAATGSEAEILAVFRQVRDEIRGQVEEFLSSCGFDSPDH